MACNHYRHQDELCDAFVFFHAHHAQFPLHCFMYRPAYGEEVADELLAITAFTEPIQSAEADAEPLSIAWLELHIVSISLRPKMAAQGLRLTMV